MAEENPESKKEKSPSADHPAGKPAKADAPQRTAKEGAAPAGEKKGGKNQPASDKQGEGPHGSGKKGGKEGAKAEAPADAGAKEGKAAAGGKGSPAEPAAPAKPVEMIGGVAKQPTAEDLLKEEMGAIKVRKAKGSKNVTSGVANVLASFNNTIVSITDLKGQVIAWSSAGKCNFRGSRKSTAYAAQIIAQDAARNAMAHGLKDIVIRVSGPGLGRDSAIRALQAIGLEVTSIVDVTPIPHNGCRPRKRRRV
jgi:small subunit ribosomal protein S11